MDLVWFRDPFPYLHNYKSSVGVEVDTFWSDDGQRGLRYSPLYGNSGFYYIKWNARTEYWAWSVISSFDTMATSGSHQNVCTMRLMETLDAFNVTVKLLDIDLFPTGLKYHEDRPYMAAMLAHTVTPYHFHMCWTTNKADKFKYFKASGMWYLNEVCEHDGVRPHGSVFQAVLGLNSPAAKWKELSSSCCKAAL